MGGVEFGITMLGAAVCKYITGGRLSLDKLTTKMTSSQLVGTLVTGQVR